MNGLLVLPVAGPLLAAGLLLLRRPRPAGPVLDRWVGLATSAGVVVVAALLLGRSLRGPVPAVRIGGWPDGIAITLAADPFSALMLLLTSVVTFLGLLFAAGTGEDALRPTVPLVLVMSAGVSGALTTADLFNLFVFVEVVLVPSYVLLALGRDRRRVVAGARLYVTVNLLASTLFLAGIGLLYGVTGTVALADLGGVAREDARAALAAGVVLIAMAAKSAVVPLHSWLPGSYSVAGPAVTALFSGLLTKVGLYALVRLYAVLFDGDRRFLWVVLLAAVLTMVVGVLSAVGEKSVRAVLTSHMVSQIGYVLVGLGLFTAAGLTAAVFFLVQYVLVKAALFMVAGIVEVRYGTDRLDRLGGLVHRETWPAVAFAGAALALVGIPPTSGFVAKLQLAGATVSAGQWWVTGAVVGVSLITLVSMLKVWNGVFWGSGEEAPERLPEVAAAGQPPREAGEPPGAATATATAVGTGAARRVALVGPPLLLAAGAVVLGIWAEPLLQAAAAAADGLLDTSAWVRAVRG